MCKNIRKIFNVFYLQKMCGYNVYSLAVLIKLNYIMIYIFFNGFSVRYQYSYSTSTYECVFSVYVKLMHKKQKYCLTFKCFFILFKKIIYNVPSVGKIILADSKHKLIRPRATYVLKKSLRHCYIEEYAYSRHTKIRQQLGQMPTKLVSQASITYLPDKQNNKRSVSLFLFNKGKRPKTLKF